MVRVYLGLGSNLGKRDTNITKALERLSERGIAIAPVSPFYETEPWGVLEQPRFLNAACGIQTDHAPHALLDLLNLLEREMGRVPTQRYGPRLIDLDILLYAGLRIDTPRLTIPHPGMLQRASVLVPLATIAASTLHPVTGLSIREHLARLGTAPDVAPYPPGLAETH